MVMRSFLDPGHDLSYPMRQGAGPVASMAIRRLPLLDKVGVGRSVWETALLGRRRQGMQGMLRPFRWLVAGICMVIMAGCTPLYRNHGYVPPDDALALIEVGVDTRETIAEKVGRPSTAGLLNDTGWYYVQSRWKTVGPREPVEIDRQVVAISFTAEGTVTDVGRYGLQDGQVIALSRRVTESNVQGAGFIRQLLGNIGGLRAEQVLQ
jgi:outer membrane protein assembly factor BamE (lipoprotein component of BamABCDE complex)